MVEPLELTGYLLLLRRLRRLICAARQTLPRRELRSTGQLCREAKHGRTVNQLYSGSVNPPRSSSGA